MKGITTLILVGFSAAAAAQVDSGNADVDEVIEMVREIVQLEREAVVGEELGLTSEERTRFWPVYDEYRAEIGNVNDRLVQLVLDYSNNFENLSDQMAGDMVDDYFDIEMDRLKVRSRYVRKFDDVLPPKKLARFVQIENKLDIVARLDLAAAIPLVE